MAPTSKVAAFLAFHVDRSEKTQAEIAAEAGLGRGNIISMMKNGVTNVPLARVPKLAKAIDVDPKKLFQLCIEEYMPELSEVLAEIYGQRLVLTDNEVKIIKKIRAISKDTDPSLTSRNEPFLKDFAKN